MRRIALTMLLVACSSPSHERPKRVPAKADAAPDGAISLLIDAISSHGEHSKDSGSETVTYRLRGNALEWDLDLAGGYQRQGADQHGKVDLTAEQIEALEQLVRDNDLLNGAAVTTEATGPTYHSLSVHVELEGKRADFELGNTPDEDPLARRTRPLIDALEALRR